MVSARPHGPRSVRFDRTAPVEPAAPVGHVTTTLRAVWGTRKPRRAPLDPARAQRSSTRRHGATRHGQRAAAFAARSAEAQAAALARARELSDPLAHKRMTVGVDTAALDATRRHVREQISSLDRSQAR